MSVYMRQLDIFDPAKNQDARATFIGIGGIGSFAAFAAAKLGIPTINVLDPDIVEEHNQPNQLYSREHVGQAKVDALSHHIAQHTDGAITVNAWIGKATDDGPLTWASEGSMVADQDAQPLSLNGPVVSGLDSMEARQTLWNNGLKYNPSVPLYLDGRLSGQLVVLYAVDPRNPTQVDAYEKTLYSDEEAEAISCTAQGIIDVGLLVGSLVSRALRRHYANLEVERITVANQETLTITTGDYLP